jgi:hypothetical protein
VRHGVEHRLRNVTKIFLEFLAVKMNPLDVVSHKVADFQNGPTTLNEHLPLFAAASK